MSAVKSTEPAMTNMTTEELQQARDYFEGTADHTMVRMPRLLIKALIAAAESVVAPPNPEPKSTEAVMDIVSQVNATCERGVIVEALVVMVTDKGGTITVWTAGMEKLADVAGFYLDRDDEDEDDT